MEIQERFKAWAIVELMGHQKIAGYVTEMVMGGSSMLRVDVPETDSQPAFTRIFNPSALYAINPVTEDVALQMARSLKAQPVISYDMQVMIQKTVQKKLNEAIELAGIEQARVEEDPEEEGNGLNF